MCLASLSQLFKEIDADDSGFVTFDEMQTVTRRSLKITKAELSDDAIKALWCKLDIDDSNQIMMDEMGAFLRLAGGA